MTNAVTHLNSKKSNNTIVRLQDGTILLYSYSSLVAKKEPNKNPEIIEGDWQHSKITTGHINAFFRGDYTF